MAIHALKRPHHPTRRRRQAMTVARQPAERPILERDYWIANSVGFRVDDGVRRVGFVEETRTDTERPGSVLLTIRTGILGRRLLVARSDDVAIIAPRAGRIWLHTGAVSPCGVR